MPGFENLNMASNGECSNPKKLGLPRRFTPTTQPTTLALGVRRAVDHLDKGDPATGETFVSTTRNDSC